MENERWSEINIYNGVYSVSSHGRVRNNTNGKILKDSNLKGYRKICLRVAGVNGGVTTNHRVHRLVAEYFVKNPNPTEYTQVHHIDNDRSNNYYLNLEWTNNSRNQLSKKTTKNRIVHKIEVVKDDKIVMILEGKKSIIEAGFDYRAVYAAAKGLTKTHHGYKFRYMRI